MYNGFVIFESGNIINVRDIIHVVTHGDSENYDYAEAYAMVFLREGDTICLTSQEYITLLEHLKNFVG